MEEIKAWSWSNLTEEETSSKIVPPTSIITETTDEEAEPRQPRVRSLQEIYNTTNEIHVVCLLADSEDLSFEKAIQDEKWRTAMDE